MRVHIYTLRFNPVFGGGSHHTLEIYIRALSESGHTPILTTFFSGDNNYKHKPCEIREENFDGGFIALQRHIAHRMRENTDADVHFLYSSYILWAGGMYKYKGGTTPVVASINNYTPGMRLHGTTPPSDGSVRNLLIRVRNRVHIAKLYLWEKLVGIQFVRKIDLLFFDSRLIQERYERFGYHAHSSDVVPAPIDPIPDTQLPSPFPDDKGVFRAVYAGRLTTDKGPDLLVKAAVKLPDAVHMHIIGSGNEEKPLRDFIQNHGLEKRVFLHGWKDREELYNFYRHSHVFIHPCRWPEPFGRVVAEALMCGLPVIATENSGPSWAAGDAGLTFRKNDVEGLVERILFFFNAPNERAAYSKKALVRARVFDSEVVSRQFLTDIESLVKSR
ncbi:hypothetical protein A3F27_01585 [Candidatus Kaiserbacteria bacterium RIFCSPHIGHO2_12_FULL_53_13]|uniref:Glycosyl transferase family 1 domain-containing protein n=1 Tax=Candidatus Kaiserbacteria bacterium RIFCSPHIGHO2_12_FULL_53_13 TaxID=1798502 RepID=A0A1F6E6E2_9BACT|nr:MAG: hypothetical protein A3F27_01585 [Candidatus Kaiserbacteria bacterium RIFCSPHIGHO2_12_FULL_53_13]OGG74743.1 MAG: hypothetical protein A3A37_01330 [Candidatus Kaiserbacteria bacterium RIFCSPLOWO2_01_FULL_52_36]